MERCTKHISGTTAPGCPHRHHPRTLAARRRAAPPASPRSSSVRAPAGHGRERPKRGGAHPAAPLRTTQTKKTIPPRRRGRPDPRPFRPLGPTTSKGNSDGAAERLGRRVPPRRSGPGVDDGKRRRRWAWAARFRKTAHGGVAETGVARLNAAAKGAMCLQGGSWLVDWVMKVGTSTHSGPASWRNAASAAELRSPNQRLRSSIRQSGRGPGG